jgi:hypothetical protein
MPFHRPAESGRHGKQHRRVDQIQEDHVSFHVHHSVEGECDIRVREIGRKELCEGSVRMNYWVLIDAGCTRTAGRSTRGGPQGACGQCYNGDRIPQHVEKLHTVAGFSTRDVVTFDNCAHIACTQLCFRDIAQQHHILIMYEVCHTYLAGLVRIEGNQPRDLRAVIDRPTLSGGRGHHHTCSTGSMTCAPTAVPPVRCSVLIGNTPAITLSSLFSFGRLHYARTFSIVARWLASAAYGG